MTYSVTSTPTFDIPPSTSTPTASPTPIPGDCAEVQISAPYPNPVALAPVKVDLVSACPKTVSWKVYTTNYRCVAAGTVLVTGKSTVAWDLRDLKGKPVANGLYYGLFKCDGRTTLRKMMVLR